MEEAAVGMAQAALEMEEAVPEKVLEKVLDLLWASLEPHKLLPSAPPPMLPPKAFPSAAHLTTAAAAHQCETNTQKVGEDRSLFLQDLRSGHWYSRPVLLNHNSHRFRTHMRI